MSKKKLIEIRLEYVSRYRYELAEILHLHKRTLSRRMKAYGYDLGRGILTPGRQEQILRDFGYQVIWVPETAEISEKNLISKLNATANEAKKKAK